MGYWFEFVKDVVVLRLMFPSCSWKKREPHSLTHFITEVLQNKSIDWFLFDSDLRYERVNPFRTMFLFIPMLSSVLQQMLEILERIQIIGNMALTVLGK